MKVAFLHPDLGIGGAERLVVDAAIGLQKKGHDVTIFTSYRDPSHCFEETRDGTLKVVVLGGRIVPRSLGGRLSILCAILRQMNLIYSLYEAKLQFDLFIVDQLSAGIPALRYMFPGARILFYCHHPDLLLTERKSLVKKIYRLPFDALEKFSTSLADEIAVNSKYTRKVFDATFGKFMPTPFVLYPVVDTDYVPEKDYDTMRSLEKFKHPILLSINRFERKKNIELALEAYSLLLHSTPETRDSLLVIAGGYDKRVSENVEYLSELHALAKKYRLPSLIVPPGEKVRFDEKVKVLFIPSMPGFLKDALLERARLLLYTPTNEHFGIVPIESMRVKTPVLATNTGGPLETIRDGVTGWLRSPDVEEWYNVLGYTLTVATEEELDRMGRAGQDQVKARFSLRILADQLDQAAQQTSQAKRSPESEARVIRNIKLVVCGIVLGLVIVIVLAYKACLFALWLLPILVESTQW